MRSGGEADYLGKAYPFTVIRDRLRRHPRPYLDFALGRLHDAAPGWLAGFLREHAELAVRLAPPEEKESFAEEASRLLARVYGAEVPPTAIVAAPGGRAAMSALAVSLLGEGDRVLVTEPGYPAFARIAAQLRARITAVPLDPHRGFEPDLASIGEDDGHRFRIASLNVPNNPSGALASPATVTAIRPRLANPGWVFNDAVYGPLTFDRPSYSMLAGDDAADVVELHSLGKLFSLGPLGVAFLAGNEDAVARVRQFSDFGTTQLTSLQIRTAIRCLEDWEHVGRTRDRLRERIDRLRETLVTLGFDPYPTAAGMYLLCRAPGSIGGRATPTAADAASTLLDEHGIAVAPWDVPPHRYLRFSAAYLAEDLDALIASGHGRPLAAD